MSRIFKDRLSTGVTPVADAFIDNYMAAANGVNVVIGECQSFPFGE